MAIVLERKIWPPSVLPLLTVGLIALWWHRRSRAATFAWGVLGALMAQIHLGAGLLLAALALWTWIKDRRSCSWGAWLAGSALGALPALPWLQVVATTGSGPDFDLRFPFPQFYGRWLTQPFGFGADYTLGWDHFTDFLAFPPLLGSSTWIAGAAHFVMFALLVVALGRRGMHHLDGRPRIGSLIIGDDDASVLINAVLWGYGGALTAMTAIGAGSHRHYMIVIAPVMALWCARLFHLTEDRWRPAAANAACAVLCAAQLTASACLLGYIHKVQVIHGEFGRTWAEQQK